MSVILRPEFPQSSPAADGAPADSSQQTPSAGAVHRIEAPALAAVDADNQHVLADLLLANIYAEVERACNRAIKSIGRPSFPLGDRKTLHYQECFREIRAEVLSRLLMIQDDIHDDMRKYNRESE